MRRKLVAGNWKMNGLFQSNAALLHGIKSGLQDICCDVLVCAPFPYLSQLASEVRQSTILVGAQNVSEYERGAYTGEVSAAMLADVGCAYALVGHSERRTIYGETDAIVLSKVKSLIAAGLSPVLCVGETLREREAGETQAVIARQVSAVIDALPVASLACLHVAYEPVWAIGTGRTATPEQAQGVHAAIRAQVAVRDENLADQLRILYGGSVKPESAEELFAQPDIDGGLIGGASLVLDDFLSICRSAS